MFKIKTPNKYLIRGNEHTHALLDTNAVNNCQKYRDLYVCKFKFTHNTSCEYDTLAKNDTKRCEYRPGSLPRLIKVNQTHIFANIGKNTTFKWSCDGPTQAFTLPKSAWIKIDRKCRIRLLNQSNENTLRAEKRIKIATIPLDMSRWTLHESTVNDDVKMGNKSLEHLLDEINSTYIQTNRPIEKIKSYPTSIDLMFKTSIIIIAVIVILLAIKRIFC